jgi:sialidase-1
MLARIHTALIAATLLACNTACTHVKTADASSPLTSDKPMLTKLDLFENEMGGNKGYRIPGIVVTTKGTILAYCEARRDALGDWGEITTMLRRSTDGGKTFDKARQIAHTGPRIEGLQAEKHEHDQLAGNPCAIVDADGKTIHFLYQINYERAFYMKSVDDGVTWSAPTEITAAFDAFRPEVNWNVLATGPTHAIQISKGAHKGRLVVPIWLSFGPKGKHGPSVSATVYSDDGGATWKRGDVVLPDEAPFKSPNECVVVELSDGRVMMNGRSPSDANRRIVSISPDGATGWSKPVFDNALIDPICCAGLTNVKGQPGTLVFSNPNNLKLDEDGKPVAGGQGKRRNLSIKISRDDGKTWISNRTLEEGASAYSDVYSMDDGTILCFYERDLRLTLAHFNLAWATAKPTDE